jgi:hypothetical protein
MKFQIAKKDHPNLKYCPGLSRLPLTSSDLQSRWPFIQTDFPGQSMESFLTEPTFFLSTSAPDDWEDLSGEPFETRDQVYALVAPGDLDSMKFYSSEDLISSWTQTDQFTDPGSRVNELFNDRQIDRLLRIVEEDSPLDSIISQIKLSREEAVQEMTFMSTIDGFKDCLHLVLKVGMLMRGWSGQGPYPLMEDETHGEVDEIKLSESLLELKNHLETDWKSFKHLKLIQSLGRWTPTTQTLWERLLVVLDGTDDDACIRMTSGYFSSTAWFGLQRFFDENPFEIQELEEIY